VPETAKTATSLQRYHGKRDFGRTPEPGPTAPRRRGKQRAFVVHAVAAGVRRRPRGPDRQARRRAVPRRARQRLAQAEVSAPAGIRGLRLHPAQRRRPGRRQPGAGRARCCRQVAACGQRRHRLGPRRGARAAAATAQARPRDAALRRRRARAGLLAAWGEARALGAAAAGGRGGLRRLDAGRPHPPCVLRGRARRQAGARHRARTGAGAGRDRHGQFRR